MLRPSPNHGAIWLPNDDDDADDIYNRCMPMKMPEVRYRILCKTYGNWTSGGVRIHPDIANSGSLISRSVSFSLAPLPSSLVSSLFRTPTDQCRHRWEMVMSNNYGDKVYPRGMVFTTPLCFAS